MTYFFIGGLLLLAAMAAYQYVRKIERRQLMRALRWMVGGLAALIAVFLLIARRFDLAMFAGAAAYTVLRSGRLGRFSFDTPAGAGDRGNVSRVKSHYFFMELDHDTGTVAGAVRAGQFARADLIDLGEADTRALIAEVSWDPDSLSLLESWLDANRRGWREYFAQTATGDAPHSEPSLDSLAEAYEVLGLQPGATDEEIRAAHRELMKAVHPDHGGSSYLASKINEARDRLLDQ
jgi:hypothetical protein